MRRPALTFRTAQLDDVDEIVEMVESAYRGDGSRAGWTTEADLLDGQRTDAAAITELIRGQLTRIVLALSAELTIGSVLLAEERNGVYLGMLTVRPNAQARGVGRALLAEVERIARSERLGRTIRMTVIGQRAELIAWYARRGYLPTGEHEPFPYGQPRFGLPRRDDLYFAVLEKKL
ncbi:MAG TPA: GNAT family N-acetyltransferase [Polyangiales bacterium]|nr:GNAT family N-acetyltransferase [Polyangiales bacterium]